MKCTICEEQETMPDSDVCGLCEKLRADAWAEQAEEAQEEWEYSLMDR